MKCHVLRTVSRDPPICKSCHNKGSTEVPAVSENCTTSESGVAESDNFFLYDFKDVGFFLLIG